jgi:mono/diheme cytochrome c family protein
MSSIEKAKGRMARPALLVPRRFSAARQKSKAGNRMKIGSGYSHALFERLTANGRKVIFAFCLLPVLLLSAACRQDMHDQPKYTPLRPSALFPDGRSARPLVEGTVARGQLREDTMFYTGKPGPGQQATAQQGLMSGGGMGTGQTLTGTDDRQQSASQGQQTVSDSGAANQKGNTTTQQATPGINTQAGQQQPSQTYQGFATTFPFPIDEAAMNRGQERFNIYCSVCHGRTGEGGGPVVLRGYRRPPSLHEPRLQSAPVGYFFDVITNGFGAMPDYSFPVSPEDRWKIIAYIRALQLSQRASIADVPTDKRDKIRSPNNQQGGQQGEHQQ